MIKVENAQTWGFEHAIRGMRNPLNSWDRSDTTFDKVYGTGFVWNLGENDLDLMRRLYKAGTEHRKYLRQIFVSMDITAPLYWWKQADQYRINVTTNSCSTMHKIAAKEFTEDDFSHEKLMNECDVPSCSPRGVLGRTIDSLNYSRKKYLETKDKDWWWQMIQLLPSSYNQKRTITMNYENVISMIKQRTGHHLDEWNDFIEELKKLPYIKEIMGDTNVESNI